MLKGKPDEGMNDSSLTLKESLDICWMSRYFLRIRILLACLAFTPTGGRPGIALGMTTLPLLKI
jgi:hypothetical protein